MKDLNITIETIFTNSECFVYKNTGNVSDFIYKRVASVYGATKKDVSRNAKIINDAFNTAQKCTLLPSELLEQRNELLKLLPELIEMAMDGYKLHCKNGSHEEFLKEDRTILYDARELIKKAQQ